MQFTESQGRALDVFQQRGLRKILGIAPTYIDRSHTNEKVFEIANKEKGADSDPQKARIIPITDMLNKKKCTLLGHVIRAAVRDAMDPLHLVTFESENLEPKTAAFRRTGRPRLKWHKETLSEAWKRMPKEITNKAVYKGTVSQRQKIKTQAVDRAIPFQQPKNKKK